LSEDIQNEISVLVAGFLRTKDIIDIEDIVTVLVVIAIILNTFAWLGKNSSWVSRCFVLEIWIAYSVGGRKMRGKSL